MWEMLNYLQGNISEILNYCQDFHYASGTKLRQNIQAETKYVTILS